MPDVLARLADAARAAGRAEFPTDILVTAGGFRVQARDGDQVQSRHVRGDELVLATANPLVEAIRTVNGRLAA